MVYKEYKAQTLAQLDFAALATMPALVEDSPSYDQAERLVSVAARPCAVVEYDGTPTGFVMPAIPDEFFIPLTTAKGVSPSTAEFQHLLNHLTVLAARDITIDDAQRRTLLRETASALAFCTNTVPTPTTFGSRPHSGVGGVGDSSRLGIPDPADRAPGEHPCRRAVSATPHHAGQAFIAHQ